MSLRTRSLFLVACLGVSGGVGSLRAQTPERMAASCATGGGDPTLCTASAVAARALLGELGIAAGFGSEVAGTASNLGQRLGTTPRLAFATRLGVVGSALPDLGDPNGLLGASFTVPTAHIDAAVGLFDGFRIMPTVGGFLAVDVFGRAGFAFLPTEEGFMGRASALTLGARAGLVRESFTLPGVSVSISKRFSGVTIVGDAAAGDPVELGVDPSVTSVRATVGKDLFAFEILAGLGWDDYSGDVVYTVSDGLAGSATGTATMDASRRMLFVGASRSFSLVFLFSVEAGLANGFDPVAAYVGSFDPTRRSFFAAASFRLTI